MLILQERRLSEEGECPYLPGRTSRFEYFFAHDLDGNDLERLLSTGWRKFGWYFFRPDCPGCKSCVPLRVPVAGFRPSKSQRRVINKNMKTEVRFGALHHSHEIFSIYEEHSRDRFGRDPAFEDFLFNFYQVSCPGVQSEYYRDERLLAVGFLDRSSRGLSSVYFIFRSEFAHHSPGIYSVLKEIELAGSLALAYYYLGYHVKGCPRMEYKSGFNPHQRYSWDESRWVDAER